jgi:hypothetical protein
MTEVRPWIGSYVSAAQFVVLRDLRVVDCSSNMDSPVGDNAQQRAWWYINEAFSEPVTRSDDVADYAPTQVLAEAFRSVGCDGIIYGSKLGGGRTVAVFDLAAAEPVACQLYRVEAVNLKFSNAENPYKHHRVIATQSRRRVDVVLGDETETRLWFTSENLPQHPCHRP